MVDRLLDEFATIVTPDTLLAWYRKLIARKGPGRPRVAQEITDLVPRFAGKNPTWGYDRLQGALANIGHVIAPNTVKNILKRHGIDPAPKRKKHTSWKGFMKAHRDVMAATDFLAVESGHPRTKDLLRIVYHSSIYTFSAHCRCDHSAQRYVHEAGGSKSG